MIDTLNMNDQVPASPEADVVHWTYNELLRHYRGAKTTIDIANRRIAQLEAYMEYVRNTNRQLNTRVTRLEQDLMIIAQEVVEEAERRDFCSDYEDFVENVNAKTSAEWLHSRIRNDTLLFTVRVDVSYKPDEIDNIISYVDNQLSTISKRSPDGDIEDVDVTYNGVE